MGRPKGSKQTEHRRKSTITLPEFWWQWLNEQKYSQSETIQRALEEYKPIADQTYELDVPPLVHEFFKGSKVTKKVGDAVRDHIRAQAKLIERLRDIN